LWAVLQKYMFLAWNYALESFLWILVGAIILVSLTILLAGPQFRSKKSETSEEALSLTGKNIDSLRENILDQDAVSGRIEEELEILNEIEKKETAWTRLGRWVGNILKLLRKEWTVVVISTGVGYSLIVCLFGILIVYEMIYDKSSESNEGFLGVVDNIGIIYGCIVYLIGMVLVYSFFILKTRGNQKWLKYSCRGAAVVLSLLPFSYLIISLVWSGYFCEDCHFSSSSEWGFAGQYEEGVVFDIYLVFASLLFSGDLKRVWKWMPVSLTNLSNENENKEEEVTRVGNILKLLRKKWMTINTYTGLRSLLYILAFLSVILFLAIFIFQFF
jgi:hypothetical protein